ncbi:glycosyltransferase family 2 protein [Roseovarius faecimaris]|uniref:Glycosyltransferase family 2 protein n=1 Tax=Roseovarius faecimaris TaxID=2494550 RepID=A0A6I6IR07_9RHOB|nr:glycosyltransferase family 2 protein [Roseovarius faecimaris]QGX99509.1 glycosyltransferase family 2 protein [Roseovarius faecimaris]
MTVTSPKILTIILNYRTPDLTVKAAEAALREMRALGGEVVIVENGSGDDSFEQITRAVTAWQAGEALRVVQSPVNGGFGAGNNFGMRQGMSDGSAPDFYYLLNSDAWPDEGAVQKLLDVMAQHPRAGFAGSHIRGTDGEDHCTVFRFPSIAGELEGAARTGLITRMLRRAVVPMEIPAETTRVDWTAGASLLIRADMLRQIGGFDETFFLYYEETELCHRARRAGWDCYYVPQSRTVHVGSASTGLKTWARTPTYWFASRRYYFTTVHGRAYAALATGARITGALIWRLRRLVQGKPQADPPHFLRDLIAFSLNGLTRPAPKPRAVPLSRPLTEDSK